MPLWQGFCSSLSCMTLLCCKKFWESKAIEKKRTLFPGCFLQRREGGGERVPSLYIAVDSLRQRVVFVCYGACFAVAVAASACGRKRDNAVRGEVNTTYLPSQQRCRSGRMFPGFRSTNHAEKVMSQMFEYGDYCNYCDYFHYFRSEPTIVSMRAFGWPNEQT